MLDWVATRESGGPLVRVGAHVFAMGAHMLMWTSRKPAMESHAIVVGTHFTWVDSQCVGLVALLLDAQKFVAWGVHVVRLVAHKDIRETNADMDAHNAARKATRICCPSTLFCGCPKKGGNFTCRESTLAHVKGLWVAMLLWCHVLVVGEQVFTWLYVGTHVIAQQKPPPQRGEGC